MGRISGVALRSSIDCLVTHDSRLLLGSITAPTQCLVGSHDDETPLAYSQALVDGIAGAELHVVEGAGHLLNAEAPGTVDALIDAHLARVESVLGVSDPRSGPIGPDEGDQIDRVARSVRAADHPEETS
jgi:hypothetical protein